MSEFNSIINAIKEAEANGALENSDFLSGCSGKKILGTLQRLVKLIPQDSVYLEIGVFQGMTLLHTALAAKEAGVQCFGIDNFAQFDSEKKNQQIIAERQAKLGLTNVNLINLDYEDALLDLNKHLNGRKIGLYFIDGPHDYRSQLMCLELAKPYLADNCIILVDDVNYNHVRQATADFITSHPNYKLIFEAYTRTHPGNMNEKEIAEVRETWWDGLHVIVHDPENKLPVMLPPTLRDRTFFENDHVIQSSRNAHVGMELAHIGASIRPFKPVKFAKSIAALFVKAYKQKRNYEYDQLNTYTNNLPPTRYNA